MKTQYVGPFGNLLRTIKQAIAQTGEGISLPRRRPRLATIPIRSSEAEGVAQKYSGRPNIGKPLNR